jgi:hypothetical protein
MAALRIRTYGHLHAVAGDLVLVQSGDGEGGIADLAEDGGGETLDQEAPEKGEADEGGAGEGGAGDEGRTGRTKAHPKKVGLLNLTFITAPWHRFCMLI